jgi:hypothetical protein
MEWIWLDCLTKVTAYYLRLFVKPPRAELCSTRYLGVGRKIRIPEIWYEIAQKIAVGKG